MKQNEPTPKKTLSSAEKAARKARRARRASAKAAKTTTKSTAVDKKNVKPTKAIVDAAAEERRRKEQERKAQDKLIGKVNWQWRKFALGLMNGLANYKAYAEAYDINDVDRNERSYRLATVLSTRLLKNASFRAYWRDLLEEQGFNHEVADTEMVRLITDPTTPAAVRRATIRDYNELQGRIVKKQSWTDDEGISLFDKDTTEFTVRVVRPKK